MNEVVLPSHLLTKSEMGKEQVPVDTVLDKSFNPEDLDHLQKHLGLIHVPGARVQALHDFGLGVEQIGGLRTWKGGMYLTQNAVLQTIGRLGQIVSDPDSKPRDIAAAAREITGLTNALTRLSTGAVKMDRDVAEVHIQRDEQKRNTFKAGMAAAPINV